MKRTTINLPPGNTLFILAMPGTNGSVWRLGDQPGMEPHRPYVVNDTSISQFGPFMNTTRWTIQSDVGEILHSASPTHYLHEVPEVIDPSNYMVLKFDIPADDLELTIPTVSGLSYAFFVDWGDDSEFGVVTDPDDAGRIHTYEAAGEYEVRLAGAVPRLQFGTFSDLGGASGGEQRLIDVMAWGDTGLTSCDQMFADCVNVNVSAKDTPNLSGVQSLRAMFAIDPSDTPSAFDGKNLVGWDVSTITSLRWFCYKAGIDDVDLSGWDVSRVTDMSSSFNESPLFTGIGLAGWDVSRVTDMSQAFGYGGLAADLSAWRPVLTGIGLSSTFRDCPDFDTDFSGWNVTGVEDMSNCLLNCLSFKGIGLELWDYTSIRNSVLLGSGLSWFCSYSGIEPAQYDLMLANWAAQAAQMPTNNMTVGMHDVQYTAAAQADRDLLVNTYNWDLTDGGLAP